MSDYTDCDNDNKNAKCYTRQKIVIGNMFPFDEDKEKPMAHEHHLGQASHNDSKSTTSVSISRPASPAKQLATEYWSRAADVLRGNPSLMTSDMLHQALKSRPPLHVIAFMLQLNPQAAGVPREGPTALQVAVKHHCSVDVIEAVIRACPYALFAGNGSYDPLTFAKLWRREDKKLIALLEKPISHWMKPHVARKGGSNGGAVSHTSSSVKPSQVVPVDDSHVHSTSLISTSMSPLERPNVNPPPILPSSASVSSLSASDRQELINIKIIAATIIKAQKKQMMLESRQRMAMLNRLKNFENKEKQARLDQFDIFKQRERKLMKTQFVALDMKEKSFQAQILAVGNRVAQVVNETARKQEEALKSHEERQERCHRSLHDTIMSLRDEITVATEKIDQVSTQTSSQIADVSTRLDREMFINTAFRENTIMKHWQFERRLGLSNDGTDVIPGVGALPDRSPIINRTAFNNNNNMPLSPQDTEETTATEDDDDDNRDEPVRIMYNVDRTEMDHFHYLHFNDHVTKTSVLKVPHDDSFDCNDMLQFTPSLIPTVVHNPAEIQMMDDDHMPLFVDPNNDGDNPEGEGGGSLSTSNHHRSGSRCGFTCFLGTTPRGVVGWRHRRSKKTKDKKSLGDNSSNNNNNKTKNKKRSIRIFKKRSKGFVRL